MKKTRILYLHGNTFLAGAEKSLLMIADNIDKELFEVFFALPGGGAFNSELNKRGIKTLNISYPRIRALVGVKGTLGKLAVFIKENEIDILHGNDLRTNLFAWLAGRKTGRQVVWHMRNLIYNEKIDLERLFSFLPDAIYCNGSNIASRFDLFGKRPAKVKVIYTGIDSSNYKDSAERWKFREEFKIGREDVVFAVIGRISLGKGHDDFIRAAAEVAGFIPSARFFVVGGSMSAEDRAVESEMRNIATWLIPEGRVIYTGFRKDMEKIMQLVDVLVLPTHAEPFGRVLMEAMSCGKPVIGTNTGGTPELLGNGGAGILVRPKNPSELARAMRLLAGNEGLRMTLGSEGRRRAEEIFDIKICIKKLQTEYRELLENE